MTHHFLGALISSIQYTQFNTVIIDESLKNDSDYDPDYDLDHDHGSAGDDLSSILQWGEFRIVQFIFNCHSTD